MEFEIGHHCDLAECHRLDFLPYKCDGCKGCFCGDHFRYETHNCSNPINDRRERFGMSVVCPLCSHDVLIPSGGSADAVVSDHIAAGCPLPPTRTPSKRCQFRRCKAREIIPFECKDCSQCYCSKHRNALDHKCQSNHAVMRLITVR